MNTWFYSDTQYTYGPISKEHLIAMIHAGQLVPGHFIMAEGAQEWQELGSSPFAGYLPQVGVAPELPAHFASAPAPAAYKPVAKPAALPVGPPQARLAPARSQTVSATGPPRGKGPIVLVVGNVSIFAAIAWHFLHLTPPNQRSPSLITDTLGNDRLDPGFRTTPALLTAESQKRPTTTTATTPAAVTPSSSRLNASQPAIPARVIELPPSRDGGDPSEIRFINKLAEEVKIQFVRDDGKLTKWWKLNAGKTFNQHTYSGHVWLITAQNGSRLGLAESTTEESTVVIDNQGVHVQAEKPPNREQQQLVSMIQFTGTNIGDAIALLRQRAVEAGLNAQIEMDPRVNAKAGSIHLDALIAPLNELLEQAAFLAGVRMTRQDSTYRIVPR